MEKASPRPKSKRIFMSKEIIKGILIMPDFWPLLWDLKPYRMTEGCDWPSVNFEALH